MDSRQASCLPLIQILSQQTPPTKTLEWPILPFSSFNKGLVWLSLLLSDGRQNWKLIGNFFEIHFNLPHVSVLHHKWGQLYCTPCANLCVLWGLGIESDCKTCCRWMCYGGMLNIKVRCHFLSLCICGCKTNASKFTVFFSHVLFFQSDIFPKTHADLASGTLWVDLLNLKTCI